MNEDIYGIMRRDIHEFDTSDYPAINEFGIPQKNKKVVGKMKDECNGRIMLEYVGLRSKLYTIKIDGQSPTMKAKGVKGSTVKNTITFDDYITCLNQKTCLTRDEYHIRSHKHNLRTERRTKVALSAHDDKRYLPLNSVDTLPWGHYEIEQIHKNKNNPTMKIMEMGNNDDGEEEPERKKPRLDA